jgi:hypothetical protein
MTMTTETKTFTYSREEAEAKARCGWHPGPVYTVIGEYGNSDGPYTRELPSMAAAIEAIRSNDLPLAPVSRDGGLVQSGGIVSFSVQRSLCYSIVEHEPRTGTDPITGWSFGGINQGHRRVYRLMDATVTHAGVPPQPVMSHEIPAEWSEYRNALAALPPRSNYATVYRDILV